MNRKNTTLFVFFLGMTLLLFNGCSSDDGPTTPGGNGTVQQTIGATGG